MACAALRAAWGALVNNVTLRLSLRVTSRHLCASAWQSALAELTASEPDARFRLILEMTEDELLMASAELPKLQGQGITLGLVDTGSVLNLLSTTRKLPCDILRLDPEMCRGLASSPDKERLFQAKVSFAKQRDCLVVAPGLDNSQDAFAATHLGADCLAGYLYSEPDLERVPAQFG